MFKDHWSEALNLPTNIFLLYVPIEASETLNMLIQTTHSYMTSAPLPPSVQQMASVEHATDWQ
jgi:hypothetical protein